MSILKNIPILHINTAGTWRGGEKQTFFLASYLHKYGYKSYCVCKKDSALHDRLLQNGIPHFPLPLKSEFDFLSARQVARFCKEKNIKIIHAHTSHAHALGYLSNMFYKVPVKIVSRRVDFRISKNIFSRIKYRFPDMYITVSDAIGKILIDDGIPAGKVTTVYSGIEHETYAGIKTGYLLKEYPGTENKIRLVNVAALTHQKDHETLLESVAILKKRTNNFILFIVGEGHLKKKLIGLTQRLSLEENIIFTGFRNDPLNFIALGDIFVMSSRWEGLGTSIIDAMAMRKPVVASETGGIPELIMHGENGLLAEKENPAALADAMYRIIIEKGLAENLSARAYEDSLKFSTENMVNGIIEVYKELLEKKGIR